MRLFTSRVIRGRYDPVEEARKYLRVSGRTIVVSFVSDPYPPQEVEERRTRKVLEVLRGNPRNKVLVLTKNTPTALLDIDLMVGDSNIWLGTTVTTLSLDQARFWERKAPPPNMRLYALLTAKRKGVKTWLSIEPIIPKITNVAGIIARTHGFIDYYVLGAFNYAKQLGYGFSKEYLRKWYQAVIPDAIKTLRSLGKEYHVKKELRRYLK